MIPCPHYNDRALPVDAIILHYTDMPSAEETLAWFVNPTSKVSAHYLIDEAGKVYPIVDETKRAWHAGMSFWQGCTDMNSCSIGIELANPGHTHGYQPFPEAQIEALLKLCEGLRSRWDIPRSRVLGHSDIAPRRKQDPGHLFPWYILAREGLGLWSLPVISHQGSVIRKSVPLLQRHPPISQRHPPVSLRHPRESGDPGHTSLRNSQLSEGVFTQKLAAIGYETVSFPDTLRAFKRHFQPYQIDDTLDAETLRLIEGVLERSTNTETGARCFIDE